MVARSRHIKDSLYKNDQVPVPPLDLLFWGLAMFYGDVSIYHDTESK